VRTYVHDECCTYVQKYLHKFFNDYLYRTYIRSSVRTVKIIVRLIPYFHYMYVRLYVRTFNSRNFLSVTGTWRYRYYGTYLRATKNSFFLLASNFLLAKWLLLLPKSFRRQNKRKKVSHNSSFKSTME